MRAIVFLIAGGLLPAGVSASAAERLLGVNLAGAEFGPGNVPGQANVHYVFPTIAELDHFRSRGMNTVRVPFLWERLQPSAQGGFDAGYLAGLDGIVEHARDIGLTVILDPHNYARYHGQIVGSDAVPLADFADLWSRLANHYLDHPNVVFGLMNEPHSMLTEQWAQAANAAIVAIRATGAGQLILVPGNAWTGAHSWYQDWYGTSNAEAMLAITDSGDNLAFELHQYFDGDYSGTSSTCRSAADTGVAQLTGVTQWLRKHGQRGFLGEFAGADNADCRAAVTNALDYLRANGDVWLGWTWWAAGPWWGDYMYTLEPTDGFTVDRPQMAWLLPFLDVLFADGFEASAR